MNLEGTNLLFGRYGYTFKHLVEHLPDVRVWLSFTGQVRQPQPYVLLIFLGFWWQGLYLTVAHVHKVLDFVHYVSENGKSTDSYWYWRSLLEICGIDWMYYVSWNFPLTFNWDNVQYVLTVQALWVEWGGGTTAQLSPFEVRFVRTTKYSFIVSFHGEHVNGDLGVSSSCFQLWVSDWS